MYAAILAASTMLVLHTVDGREIDINVDQITHMHEARPEGDPDAGKYFTTKVRCMINMADGKFVNVVEECAVVRAMLSKMGIDN